MTRIADQKCRDHPILASSSSGFDQMESMLSMNGMERSPNAVASAGTRCTAPPKCHTEVSDSSDGRDAQRATMSVITVLPIHSGRSI